MDVDGDGDVDIDAVVRSLRSTAVVAAAMDDASRELSGDFPSSPSGNVAEVFDPFDAFALLERAEPFEPQDAGFLMAAKHGAVGVAPDEPAHEAAALQRAAALAGSLAAFPEEHGFQEGFFRDARAETSAAARFGGVRARKAYRFAKRGRAPARRRGGGRARPERRRAPRPEPTVGRGRAGVVRRAVKR